MAPTIPCKRPKVAITTETVASGPLAHRATCHVPGCAWGYGPAVKTDAQQQAGWHRQAHRSAVPAVEITRGDRGFVGTCSCGWVTFDGQQTSRQSVDETLAYHQSSVHGLVSC